MQHLEVSGAVRPIYGSLGVKRIMWLVVVLQNQYALQCSLCWRLYALVVFKIQQLWPQCGSSKLPIKCYILV